MRKKSQFQLDGWILPGGSAPRRNTALGRLKRAVGSTGFFRRRRVPGSGAVGLGANLCAKGRFRFDSMYNFLYYISEVGGVQPGNLNSSCVRDPVAGALELD